MKKFYAVCASVLLITSSYSQTWVWAESFGGTSYDDGNAIAVDAAGNSYVTGSFQGTATFGSFTLNSVGDNDVFTAKFDPSGNCLWAKSGGGLYGDAGYGICLDAQNNVYITGYYNAASITFGSFTLATAVWDDIFLVKYDNNGNEQWAVKAGGSQNDYGYGLTSDGTNIFMVGNFQSTGSFGSNVVSSSGWGDVVVAKYNSSSGSCIWAVKGGGSGNDNGKAICLGGTNIYVTGFFVGSATFGTTPALSSSGFEDAFTAMLDQNGSWVWAKKGGGGQNDGGLGIVADGAGNCYVTGYYDGTGTFSPSTLTSAGVQDVFIVKYDQTGTVVMAKSHGGWGNDKGYGIVRDALGNLLVAGSFEGTANFDVNQIQTSGISDFFVARCSPVNGSNVWVSKAGAEDEDQCFGIGIDGSNNVYITGYFRTSCDFASLTSLTANVFNEIYVAKLSYPLGIETTQLAEFSMGPNPATNELVINSLNASSSSWTCIIYNSIGLELLRQSFNTMTGAVDVRELPSGIYFAELQSGNGLKSEKAKFVKN